MVQLTTMVKKTVDVKSVSVHVKVSDRGSYDFKSPEGEVIKSIDEDYVPSFFPGEHYGDYLILDIDLDSGQILNWVKPQPSEIESALASED